MTTEGDEGSTRNGEEAQVRCHAGHMYPEHPVAFTWRGEERQVAAVEQAWREPGLRLFVVRDSEGEKFRLSYEEPRDRWFVARK